MASSAKICNNRPEGSSYGLSPDTKVELYLNCLVQPEEEQQQQQQHGSGGVVLLDLKGLAAIYVVKFSKCNDKLPIRIIFCPKGKKKEEEENKNKTSGAEENVSPFLFSLDLGKEDLEDHCEIQLGHTPEEADDDPSSLSQIYCCHFPAIFVPEKSLCITGLCSVTRFLLRNTCDQIPGHSCEQLLGFMGKPLVWLISFGRRSFRLHVMLIKNTVIFTYILILQMIKYILNWCSDGRESPRIRAIWTLDSYILDRSGL